MNKFKRFKTILGSEPIERHGFFFTPNHKVAKDYAGEYGEHFVKTIKTAGYDGMIFHEHSPHDNTKHESHVVFHPEQIKIKKVV